MKKENMTIAALALLLAACGNEEIIENNEVGTAVKVPMTFTVGTPQTRTSLDGTDVYWTEGDKVAINDGTDTNEFTATTVSGSSATLTGEAALADTYIAFYPNKILESITDGYITFTLPAEQTATANGFAEELNPSWAQTTAEDGNTLQFHNLCALVKFTINDGFDVSGFTLKSANGELLAGRQYYQPSSNGRVFLEDDVTEVLLKGDFAAGETYYFVVNPVTLTNGFSLVYTNNAGRIFSKSISQSVTFEAAKITNLGTLSTSSFEEQVIDNKAFIDAVGEQVEWTTNEDGTVSLTPENLAAIENVTSLDVSEKSLSDLSGIEYFVNLISLDCKKNNLTSLDVSNLTKLTALTCNDNQLTSLNVSSLTKLSILYCQNNQLKTLDVSQNTALWNLNCSNNQLSELDVANNPKLQTLSCADNRLEALDIEKNTSLSTLYCNNNQLAELSVSKNTMLTKLYCYANRMSELDVKKNLKLKALYCGAQTTDGSTPQTLKLTLPADLKDVWDKGASVSTGWNDHVDVKTDGMNSSHGGFGDGGTVEW